jgi:hypothetical protein
MSRLSHLITRQKPKASLGNTAAIAIFAGLIFVSLNIIKRATDFETPKFNTELRVVDFLEFQQRPSAVDVVELPQELPVVAVDVVKLSRRLPAVDPSASVWTALCCKAMFGSVDFSRVALWVAYNKLLGFDHVFLYYHDILEDFPGFDELKSLPYLTMTPMKGEVVVLLAKSQNSTNGTSIPYSRFVGASKQHADQRALERQCFNNHAKDYDWVLIADIDEYLSFNEEMGVKGFIAKYSDNKTKSLGIGKKMYTLSARADAVDSGFGLDNYPFSPGIYCTIDYPKINFPRGGFRLKNRKECSGYYGSTKLILRPQYHSKGIRVHGPRQPNKEDGEIQINTDIARFREYQFIHQMINATHHEKVDYLVTSGVGLRLAFFDDAYQRNKNGTWTIQYDDEPSRWYQYVARRGLDSSPKSLL